MKLPSIHLAYIRIHPTWTDPLFWQDVRRLSASEWKDRLKRNTRRRTIA